MVKFAIKDMKIRVMILLFMLMIFNGVLAQDLEGAIQRLRSKKLLTRIISNVERDQGQYAYLRDIIIAIDELMSSLAPSSNLTSKINRLETEIQEIREIDRDSTKKPIGDEVENLVRKFIVSLIKEQDSKINLINMKMKSDSIEVAMLNERFTILENTSSKIDIPKEKKFVIPTYNKQFLMGTIAVLTFISLFVR